MRTSRITMGTSSLDEAPQATYTLGAATECEHVGRLQAQRKHILIMSPLLGTKNLSSLMLLAPF